MRIVSHNPHRSSSPLQSGRSTLIWSNLSSSFIPPCRLSFSAVVFLPWCPVRATSAGALPLSSWFYVGWHPMPQKKAADFSLPFVCSFRGIISRMTSSFAAELYSAFYSVYAPLIYVRLYFTSCPVRVYSFSPRRMKIRPSRRILTGEACSVMCSMCVTSPGRRMESSLPPIVK